MMGTFDSPGGLSLSTISLTSGEEDPIMSTVHSSRNKRPEYLRSFSGNSVRLRDPSSWIVKDEPSFKPPPSPLALVEPNDIGGSKDFALKTKGISKSGYQSPASKVRELATLFEKSSSASPNNVRIGTNGASLAREASDNSLRMSMSPDESNFVREALSNRLNAVSVTESINDAKSKTSPSGGASDALPGKPPLLSYRSSSDLSEGRMSQQKSGQSPLGGTIESQPLGSVANIAKIFDKGHAPKPPATFAKQGSGKLAQALAKAHIDINDVEHSPIVGQSQGQTSEKQGKQIDPVTLAPEQYPISLGKRSTLFSSGLPFRKRNVPIQTPKEEPVTDPVASEPVVFEPLIDEIDAKDLEVDETDDDHDMVENDDIFKRIGSSKEFMPRRLRSKEVMSDISPLLRTNGRKQASSTQNALDKPWRDFYKAVLEVLTSELNFVSKWHVANRLFIDPLLDRLGEERTLRLVPLTCWYNIFRFHEALLGELMESITVLWGKNFANFGPHRMILDMKELIKSSVDKMSDYFAKVKEMEDREMFLEKVQVKDWFLKMNEAMAKHADALAIARDFIVHYPTAVGYLDTMSAKKKAFMAELESNEELEGLRFRDFLIQPVQNVCRYHLLYKAVVEKLPDESLNAPAVATQTKLAQLAQRMNDAMRREDRKSAEELLAKLKSNNNNRFASRLIPKGFLFPQKHSSGSSEIEMDLHDVTTVALREGEMQILSVSESSFGEDTKQSQSLNDYLVSKGKVRGLLCTNQLLLIETSRLWTNPTVSHSFRFSLDWNGLRVQEDETRPEVLHLIFENDAGEVDVAFEVEVASKQGWLRDLGDVCTRTKNARQRELAAQQQMSKRKSMTPMRDDVGNSETSLNSSMSSM